jgi:hypothetical protein
LASENEDEDEGEDEKAFEALADVLSRILAREPLLGRLWTMQAMDALDVEGAALVLRRLAALCGGDETVALARLAAAELEPVAAVGEGAERLAEVEGLLAREAERGGNGCGDGGEGGGDDAAAWEARHAQALAAVAALSEGDCVLLLRRWLVSLGACDASLMLSLRRCAPTQDGLAPLGDDDDKAPLLLQTAAAAGVLKWGGDDDDGEEHERSSSSSTTRAAPVYLAYCVHVVDVGPKPPSKVLAKAALEDSIVALAAQHLAGDKGREGGEREGCK